MALGLTQNPTMKVNKQRIKHLVKKNSFKQKEIAVKIGVTPQDWNNWMFRGIFPHFEKLKEVAVILNVDVDSLLAPEEISEPSMRYGKNTFIPKEEVVPFYEIETHTNLSLFWNDHTTVEPKDHIYLPGLQADFIFPFYGSGMQPKISNGDWIALRKFNDLAIFNYGSLHLIVTQEQIMVRYVKKSEKPKTILLCANDDFHDDIELPISAIKALYGVVTVIKRETF